MTAQEERNYGRGHGREELRNDSRVDNRNESRAERTGRGRGRGDATEKGEKITMSHILCQLHIRKAITILSKFHCSWSNKFIVTILMRLSMENRGITISVFVFLANEGHYKCSVGN